MHSAGTRSIGACRVLLLLTHLVDASGRSYALRKQPEDALLPSAHASIASSG
jgi:hypothetical protein